MELYQLKGFTEVARTGNLTKASEKLNLSQPALSIQIKQLEQEFGEALFERIGRGLILSAFGKMVLPKAEEILAAAERLKENTADIENLKHGSITIGTNDSNCLYVLPDVISSFRNKYPGINISLNNSHSKDVISWVREGDVELGIVTLPADGNDLTAIELYSREDALILPPAHPLRSAKRITPADIAKYALLVLNKGSISHENLLNALAGHGVNTQRLLRVGSIEVIKRYCEIGLGISIVPVLNVRNEAESGKLLTKPLPWLKKLSVGVIYRTKSYLSPAVRVFLDLLKKHTSLLIGKKNS